MSPEFYKHLQFIEPATKVDGISLEKEDPKIQKNLKKLESNRRWQREFKAKLQNDPIAREEYLKRHRASQRRYKNRIKEQRKRQQELLELQKDPIAWAEFLERQMQTTEASAQTVHEPQMNQMDEEVGIDMSLQTQREESKKMKPKEAEQNGETPWRSFMNRKMQNQEELEEYRRKHRQRNREYYKRKMEKLQQDPVKLEEYKKKKKLANQQYQQKVKIYNEMLS